ncbi:hypothetical protein FDP41_006182 [Naegleria fowleri]|uniref:Uncharacterized protein n=1 Tax=Naegleria fowleri TaxID=5763 RepID=A0A6A5BKL9_NAEFO|nr:uncharacterized protein FDP41_006182 [Naegleria fowleri]KAF0974708.1 hypothetical protein FDP41_006182 [Naegleria fowleri]
MFLLSKHYYELFMNSEVLFHKLCLVFCKVNDIPLQVIDHQMKLLLNEGDDRSASILQCSSDTSHPHNRDHLSRKYLQVFKCLIRNHGYSWDTEYSYYKAEKYSNIYTCNERTLCVLEKPLHGEFITVKARKLLNPGHFYSWRYDLELYNPTEVSNSFKIMLGVESLDFFPFNSQTSGDVVGWQSNSKGCALIIGAKEVIRSACASTKDSILHLPSCPKTFKTGDSIIVEFDFRVKDVKDQEVEAYRETKRSKYFFSRITSKNKVQFGKIRFYLLLRNEELESSSLHHEMMQQELHPLTDWLEFGDPRFAPYVPACSLNKMQSVSILPRY